MPFDWTQYLKIAEFVYQQNLDCQGITKEAVSRCAVSRAYYAAFCYARKNARDLWGFSCTGRDDHKNLPTFLIERKAMPGTASVLKRIRIWRESCDYDDDLALPNINAEYAIKEAQRIIDDISARVKKENERVK